MPFNLTTERHTSASSAVVLGMRLKKYRYLHAQDEIKFCCYH